MAAQKPSIILVSEVPTVFWPPWTLHACVAQTQEGRVPRLTLTQFQELGTIVSLACSQDDAGSDRLTW